MTPRPGDNGGVFRPRTPPADRRASSVATAVAVLVLVLALALLAGCGAARSADPPLACGAAAVAATAAVDNTAADDIYGNELAGMEVSFDSAQVTGAADLSAAVAADDDAAARTAVSRLVFHPAWHIVRLRALDAGGRVLADVGGPYVIAPVHGFLRLHGRVVGSFVMSVQDDVGYTKLETRFIGNPVGIYVGGKLVAERDAALPGGPPSGAELTLGGVSYRVLSESYGAFPSGTLNAVILVPPPAGPAQAQPCSVVRAGEFGRIAERFARLAVSLPAHYPGFARTVQIYTGAEVFVREGTKQLASTSGTGPATLPSAGTVSYQGRRWLVFSFEPRPSTRVYVLAPPAA